MDVSAFVLGRGVNIRPEGIRNFILKISIIIMLMLKKFWVFGLFFVFLGLVSCGSLQESVPAQNSSSVGYVRFSVVKLGNSFQALSFKTFSTQTYALVTILDSQGQKVKDRFSVTASDSQISLAPGTYQLTEFMVPGPDNNPLYIAPVKDSAKAYLVQKPLPISFTIAVNQTLTLSVEVLSATASATEFGYSKLTYVVVNTIPIGISVIENNSLMVTANLEVSFGNGNAVTLPLKAQTQVIDLPDLDTIQTYTFRVTKDDLTPVTKTISKTDLQNYTTSPLMISIQNPHFLPLHIQGNGIYNSLDEKIILRGVNIADPWYLDKVDHVAAETLVQRLKQDWHVNLIRVPIHPGVFKDTPDYLQRYIDPIITMARKYQVYVLLDWHGIGNLNTGISFLCDTTNVAWLNQYPWNLITSPNTVYNSDLSLAKVFFKQVGARYKQDYWVLYGTFNEPQDISWIDHKRIAESLIDILRYENPKALVTVSGIDFGYNLTEAISNPVARESVIYELHPYPNRALSEWMAFVDTLSGNYPILFGEWGFPFMNTGDETYAKALTNYADANGIHWTAWCYHPTWDPNMISGFTPEVLTGFGSFLKGVLTE